MSSSHQCSDGSVLLFFLGSNLISFKILIWVCILIESYINFVLHRCALCFFFFFYLIPEGIMVKVPREHFLFRLFLPIWEKKICEPGRENFLLDFPSSLFSLVFQIVKNIIFHSIFLSIFSILPKFTPTKHSIKARKCVVNGHPVPVNTTLFIVSFNCTCDLLILVVKVVWVLFWHSQIAWKLPILSFQDCIWGRGFRINAFKSILI